MDKFTMIQEHYHILKENFSEDFVVKHMRKHVLWYLKGCVNANSIKKQVCELNSIDEVLNLLKENKKILWEK